MRSPATGRLPSSRPSLRLYYPAPSVSACYPKVQEFSYERSFRRISTESPSGSLPVTIVLTPRSPPPSNGFIVHGQMRREYIRGAGKKKLHKLLEYGSVASWRLYRRFAYNASWIDTELYRYFAEDIFKMARLGLSNIEICIFGVD